MDYYRKNIDNTANNLKFKDADGCFYIKIK